MPIYTKTGDRGETSLYGGKRVSKSHDRIEAYGLVDELNSWMGLLVSEITFEEKQSLLQKIQSDLFVVGGFLAGWDHDLHNLATRVSEIEVEIDVMEEMLPSLNHFILPGGSSIAAKTHIARSICRRAERAIVKVYEQHAGEKRGKYEKILQYMNRLSDWLFMLARFLNYTFKIEDVPWRGIERKQDQ